MFIFFCVSDLLYQSVQHYGFAIVQHVIQVFSVTLFLTGPF